MSKDGNTLFKPDGSGIRNPTTNAKENGVINNPPRFGELGGLSSAGKGIKRNKAVIRKPGFEK
jgi:hypothetical protein